MTGLECGLEDLAALASIPYRSHHQRMSEGATGPAEHLERSRKPFEREARVQSFLLEETEETGRGENDAIGMAASTKREDNGHPNSRD